MRLSVFVKLTGYLQSFSLNF